MSSTVTSPAGRPQSCRHPVTRIGMFAPSVLEHGTEVTRAFLARAADAGVDHVCCGDHVSFEADG